ncbi:hypothetical protein VUR80DRAFT_2790 [Thermomyces stellatus]
MYLHLLEVGDQVIHLPHAHLIVPRQDWIGRRALGAVSAVATVTRPPSVLDASAFSIRSVMILASSQSSCACRQKPMRRQAFSGVNASPAIMLCWDEEESSPQLCSQIGLPVVERVPDRCYAGGRAYRVLVLEHEGVHSWRVTAISITTQGPGYKLGRALEWGALTRYDGKQVKRAQVCQRPAHVPAHLPRGRPSRRPRGTSPKTAGASGRPTPGAPPGTPRPSPPRSSPPAGLHVHLHLLDHHPRREVVEGNEGVVEEEYPEEYAVIFVPVSGPAR